MESESKPTVHENDPIGICGHTGLLRHHFYFTEPQTIGELFNKGAGIPEDLMATPNMPVSWAAVCDTCVTTGLGGLSIHLVRRLKDLRNDGKEWLKS